MFLYVGYDGILGEGELVSSSLAVVVQRSHHTRKLLLVLECEVDRMVVDGVVIRILWEQGAVTHAHPTSCNVTSDLSNALEDLLVDGVFELHASVKRVGLVVLD